MQVAEALTCLGIDRVIWIDDLFNKSPPDLAEMLINASDLALTCGFDDIAPILKKKVYGEEGLQDELSDRLTELGPKRAEEIRTIFFAQESVQTMVVTAELTDPAVVRICELLKIAELDRWTFDQGTSGIPALCASGDGSTAYIVDLKEKGKSSTAGLAILSLLHANRSKGTAFILTHEADRKGETQREAELRDHLMEASDMALEIPICVVAKERLLTPEKDGDVEEDLLIAVKRAALRKSLSAVVYSAKTIVEESFQSAAKTLLSVPPEQLEEYVFERGYKEGVSELHVVERIVTSQIAQKLRMFFGTNEAVLKSAHRLRELKSIVLSNSVIEGDPRLAEFRLAEVWESSDLINSALAPIACGDVFVTDLFEQVPGNKRMFVLLAQPCDIALRPKDKPRSRDTAFLVPLSKLSDPSEARNKDYVLPCKLEDQYWECDFARTSAVRLDVLDLASFRTDGRVRVDLGHQPSRDLVPSQSRVYDKRTASASKALADGSFVGEKGRSDHPALQLAFAWEGDFKQYFCAQLEQAANANPQANVPALPKRVTWRLLRSGRVRMPYAAALLDYYLSGMSRHAFDMDYMSPGQKAAAPVEQAAKTETASSASDAGSGSSDSPT